MTTGLARANFDEEWDRLLGPELHADVRQLREWLDNHPSRRHLLDYLKRNDLDAYRSLIQDLGIRR